MKTFPIFGVVCKGAMYYWFDLSWGQSWASGSGYLAVVPWGEQKARRGYCMDNRVLVDPSDCEVELLGWTRMDETEEPRIELVAEIKP